MLINNVILKEKSILVNQDMPSAKMKIKTRRSNIMPDSVKDSIFQCLIKNELTLEDENEHKLVEINLSYLVVVELQEENYSKNMVDAIYEKIASMYNKTMNDLLKETLYPPIPLNINVKYE